MGLFDKTKTFVSTSASRMIPDDQIPKSHKKAMIQAIIRGDNISDTMLREGANSSAFKFEQMYRYAKSGQYFYGLPSAREVSEPDVVPIVQSIIGAELNASITVDYLKIAEPIPKHFGLQVLFDDYGYDRFSGEIQSLSDKHGFPVYLKTMISYIPVDSIDDIDFSVIQLEESLVPVNTGYHYGNNSQSNGATKADIYNYLKDIGRVNTSKDFVYDLEEGAVPRVEVIYVWDEIRETVKQTDTGKSYTMTEAVPHESSFVYNIPNSTDENARYFYQVGYRRSGNDYGFWTYEYQSKKYPELDQFFDVQYNREGTYFPFAVFRRQFTNRASSVYDHTEEHKSTAQLLNFINMDYTSIGSSINENPDIADVAQAAMVMAVPMDTENNLEARYLYEYFERLQRTTTNIGFSFDNGFTNRSISANNAITWSDADFSLTLSYNSITNKTIGESFGEVGDYKVDVTDHSLSYTTTVGKNDREQTHTRSYKNYHIKKQLTSGLCQVITVVNPVAKYDIDYKRSYYSTQDNSILLIPLDYLICKKYRVKEREELYHRSLHLIFNAKKVVKLKWYQRGFFQVIVIIIAIAIVYFSAGQLTDLAVTLVGLVEAGLTYLAIVVLLEYILIKAITVYAFRILAKELGDEFAFAVAIILAAYGGWEYMQDNPAMSEMLMAISTNLISANNYVIEQDIRAIMSEQEELSALKTENEKELEKAMELLDNNNDFLDPYTFLGKKPNIIQGESPESMYNRTIHMGNPADLTYKSIEQHVEISLRLPGIDK